MEALAEYLERVFHLAGRTGGQVPVYLIQLALRQRLSDIFTIPNFSPI